MQNSNFLFTESSTNSLNRVSNIDILKSIIDPTTGQQYNGIILEGEFASIDVLNNNNRYYSEDNYIGFIELLKQQIHSKKGLYGCLEHPKTYATDSRDVSHKILDIWYSKELKKVFGVIMLLNTPNGLIAQEFVKSNGQLCVSARGGGSEKQNPDGSINAILKLLITFDIVYHPGFSTAMIDIVKINENVDNYVEHQKLFENTLNLNIFEPTNKCFNLNENLKPTNWERLNVFNLNYKPNLNESISKEDKLENKSDEKKLENGDTVTKNKAENELSSAVHQELEQNQKALFENQMNNAVGKFKKLNNAVYDNSAGFLSEEELLKK